MADTEKEVKKFNRRDMLLDDERAFLKQKDEEGWKLIKVSNTKYVYEKCEPGEYNTFFYYEPSPGERDKNIIRARESGAEILHMRGSNNYKYFVRRADLGPFAMQKDKALNLRAHRSQRFIQGFNLLVCIAAMIAIVRYFLRFLLVGGANDPAVLALFVIFIVADLLILVKALRRFIYYQRRSKELAKAGTVDIARQAKKKRSDSEE